MKKMSKAQNGKKLTVAQTERKADSLNKEANRKAQLAMRTVIDRSVPSKVAVRKGDSIANEGRKDFDRAQKLRSNIYKTKKAAGYKNGGNVKKK